MTDHTHYLKKCLELAEKGRKEVAPNPMVGAILVHNGKIIGEGYHTKYGAPHAEVEAIEDAKKQGNENLISQATLYVSLEPCCHTGKTPPCTQTIIDHNIPHVVIAMQDPNPQMAGNGIQKLKEAGITTELIELPEATELNKIFIKNITTHLPYIHLKIAVTKDGKLSEKKGTRTKLTTEKEDIEVHRLRCLYDGILVGRGTVEIDNPKLTCRLKELTNGLEEGKNPIRIILDSKLQIPASADIFKQEGITYIATTQKTTGKSDHAEIIVCKPGLRTNHIDLKDLLNKLYEKGIFSVLVEGGEQVVQSFIEQDLIDEMTVFESHITSSDPTLSSIYTPKLDRKVRNLKMKKVALESEEMRKGATNRPF